MPSRIIGESSTLSRARGAQVRRLKEQMARERGASITPSPEGGRCLSPGQRDCGLAESAAQRGSGASPPPLPVTPALSAVEPGSRTATPQHVLGITVWKLELPGAADGAAAPAEEEHAFLRGKLRDMEARLVKAQAGSVRA